VRILMLLSTSSVTGPAELCLDDAKALRAAGHSVVFGYDTRRPGNYGEAIKEAGFEALTELTLCRKSSPVDLFRDVTRLRKLLWNVDLIHCRFSHDHVVALMASRSLKERPALVRTVETAGAARPGLLRTPLLKACDAVIVSCDRYAKRLKDGHRLPEAMVHVLPGRVDAKRFCPGDGTPMRELLEVGAKDVLFGIVARIKADRLHEVLLRALARVARELPRAKVVIVGRGEHEPVLRRLASVLGVEDRLLYAGYRTGADLVTAYRALDVSVWLAEGNDGTCRSVLEAMACAVPMIAGNEGAMAELVRDGQDGLVVAPRDEAVAEAMRKVMDPNLRRSMSRSAFARAEGYTAQARATKLVKIYDAAHCRRLEHL
jgi:glycosyltransferase involved in cell wall biosynthesis